MTPRATYRLQLHRDFDFDAAARLVPYLQQLGVSHVYTSPCLRARPGSRHGYDIVAHDEVNPELGGAAALQRFSNALHAAGLGHLADIVPNHMGVWGSDNRLWLDVLAWGEESRFAGWFDIDWEPDRRYLQGKLLAPILGNQYGIELEAGHLQLRFDAQSGEFAMWCYDTHKLPICPLHYESILGDEHYGLQELGDDFSALTEWRPQMALRAGELQRQLATLVGADAEARAALDGALARYNGKDAQSRTVLDALVQRQHWRATHFRVAGDDINYRRFFNVSELAGLRIELPAVFEHVHQLPLRWLASGIVDGLRIDHIDGLLDPTGYLERLRAAADAAAPAAPYMVVEKILARDESLPTDWPVDGTTGYEFGALVGGWLIDPAGQIALDALYERAMGGDPHWGSILRTSKLQIMDNEMAAELNVLARDAARVARQSSRTADFTGNILRRAIRAFIAALPVYRSYMHANGELSEADRARLQSAIEAARAEEPELDPSVFDFLQRLLTGALLGPRSAYTRHTVIRCARKLQQYSGPVMAKGLEDTALFRYGRLLALNEVGTDPRHFGNATADLHAFNLRRSPRTMLGTSTHDTKWGEDARARLAVLSELPAAWADFTTAAMAALSAGGGDAATPGVAVAERSDVYMLLQRVLASWPAEWTLPEPEAAGTALPARLPGRAEYATRLKDATVKALREGKLHSSWSLPNEAREQRLGKAIDALLDWLAGDAGARKFLAQIASLGVRNSLAQLGLKLTAPGIPDLYQGAEGWNFSLLDPDNRRAIDFDSRRQLLQRAAAMAGIDAATLAALLTNWQDGQLKLLVTQRLLAHRREHQSLYADGEYLPLNVVGQRRDELMAFARVRGHEVLLVALSRFPSRRSDAPGDQFDWQDTAVQLPAALVDRGSGDKYVSVVDGADARAALSLSATALLSVLPLAVWYRPAG